MKKIINCAFTVLMFGSAASAAVPDFINFQGRLLDSNKLPRNGSFSMTFKICDSLAGACVPACAVGNPCLWTEAQTITVTNGIFAAKLGAVAPISADVFSAAARYLDITVAGETLSPREQLVAGPFSFKAALADGLVNNDGSALLRVSSVALSGFYSDNAVRSRLGLVIGADVQAYDADLTTYGGITPSANIQSLLGSADYATARTNLGLAIGTNVQAYDADLTTYGGITPSANIQSLLGSADYATARTNLGLAIGTNVQAYDADLTTYGGITPSANIQSLLGSADYATARTNLGLTIGTNVQAYDADLTTLAGLDGSTLLKISSVAISAFYSAPDIRTNLGLAIGTNVQAYDADLTTYGGITPSANIQSLLGSADYATARTNLGLAIGTNVQAYDADLTTLAGLDGSPLLKVSSVAISAFYSAPDIRTNLGLAIGSNVQAYDADLTTYGGITPSANIQSLLGSADYATARTNLGLAIGSNVQAYDADLTTYGGITPSANIQSLLGSADYATARTNLGLAIGSNVQAYDADLGFLAAGLTSAQIFVGNASNQPAAATVTGDVTISNTGVTAIGALKVTDGMLAGSITPSKITNTAAVLTANTFSGAQTYSDGAAINMSAVNNSGAAEGLRLPQAADVSAGTAEGQVAWDTDGDLLQVGTGAGIKTVGIPNNISTYAVAGTYIWRKPPGVSTVYVQLWGGGGGGGVAGANASDGGGGGGAYCAGLVTVTGDVTVVVGAASAAGGAGNFSRFSAATVITAAGGSTNTGIAGGAGGACTNGTIQMTGKAGGSTLAVDGAAGGDGGSSPMGGGGGQGGTAVATGGTGQAGQAGSAPGGGGGGGSESAGAASTGAVGYVIVTY